jgi:hypothetical protein
MESKMRTVIVALICLLSTIGSHAAELPDSVINQDWCLDNTPRRNSFPESRPVEIYRPVDGCKSLVFKRDAVIWNKAGEQASCAIKSIDLKQTKSLWIRGSCQARDGSFYALDFRFDDTSLPREGRFLFVMFPPYMPLAVAPPSQ